MSSPHGKFHSNSDANYMPLPTSPPPYSECLDPPSQGCPQPDYAQPQYLGPLGQRIIGPERTRITCMSCNETMITRIERTSSTKTHLMAMLLCVLGLWPCVCLPYLMDSCLNTDHYCSSCRAYLGTYSRL